MKRAIVGIILLLAVGGGGVYWLKHKGGEAPPAGDKPGEAKAEGARVTHDESGHVIVKMDDETQGNMGLTVGKPAAAELAPELKGYGRVFDPAALAALVSELASAQASHGASSNELARLKALAGQGNASERALQAGEAAALRDQLAVQAARDRLALIWGNGVAGQTDLPAFIRSLISQTTALVRIDLPAGETLKSPPAGARILTMTGGAAEADYLGAAPNVDPQTLGQGSFLLVKPAGFRLLPGDALIGYLKLPGAPLTGVIIPSQAVVRTEGAGWVYVFNSGGEGFTRLEVPLDRPDPAGWFIAHGVSTNDNLVVVGAQTLLSEELKGALKPD